MVVPLSHVSDPKLARAGGGESSLHEVFGFLRSRIGLRGEDPLRPFHAAHSRQPHQPLGLITTNSPSLSAEQGMHLPTAADAVVLRMQPRDFRDEQVVAESAR